MVRALVQQLRPHQWVKNVLVVVPIVLAHRLHNVDSLLFVFLAFVSFSLCASAVYAINDVVDAEADRQHPRKKHRPVASGRLQPAVAIVLAVVLMASAAGVAVLIPGSFLLWLVVYALASTMYTFVLKRVVIIDVLVLSGLYTVRLFAGGEASGTAVSPWLLMLGMFIFTSIAFVKRFTELSSMPLSTSKVAGRGYQREDIEIVRVLGPIVGLMSVVVLAFYITGPDVQVLYRTPEWLWLAVPLLMYWIFDVWVQANRGLVHDDPIVHLLRDSRGWAVMAALALVAGLAR